MFNEMLSASGVRPEYQAIHDWVEREGVEALLARKQEADELFRRVGITFAVYTEGGDPERLIPFDMIPRAFSSDEWKIIHDGSTQRARALNAFLSDVYGEQEILKAGRIPREVVDRNPAFEPVMRDIRPPRDVWSHIMGVDIVRTGPSGFYVLEDNCRTPSGISYVLENREAMMRMFPSLFQKRMIKPVDHYPAMLAEAMAHCAPEDAGENPTLALLTPGQYNSAYYEHSFLADRMGAELVEGQDLFVRDGQLFMRTIRGPERVHVLYRRIDDAFLDPECPGFNPDSMLGVPGLMEAYRHGGVTVVNAPGTGVADDKATYVFVPEMIDFYLGEKPILDNVPTHRCALADECTYVLENLENLVVKEVHGSGGYGMLIGPASTRAEREAYAARVRAEPEGFIAQPVLDLSASPTLTENGLQPRHVDLRPFVVTGDRPRLIPGGLTRVALREGSLVVNSSQGGGVKDTWVLSDRALGGFDHA